MYDVAIVGAGMGGMATAARLQVAGLSTIVYESHGQVGGCAGFFRRRGFSFDVGATTLVDFEPGGVGGELLESIGMNPPEHELLPGYTAWLPDRVVHLHRDAGRWSQERLQAFGDTPDHRKFWGFVDRLADVFWAATRRGVKLPIRSISDVARSVTAVGIRNIPLAKYLSWTMADALRAHKLREDRALASLLSMLIEDTVHSTLDDAPLINAALGITIRGAGLTRARGGMQGFWRSFVARYRESGGTLRVGCPVLRISGREPNFIVETRHGPFAARQVVSAVPIELTAQLAPPTVGQKLRPYETRNVGSRGGSVVVFLGVPDDEVAGQEFTHHQLLHDYAAPLGDGNNMFVSVSAAGDLESAPTRCRAVMISTHCDLSEWRDQTSDEYARCKREIGERLLTLARRVYPRLGSRPLVCEIGTPRTFERFTRRPHGAVGGVRQTLHNTNQRAVPHEIGVPGFWLAGDTTWPGLGTVACVVGSRIVAEGVLRRARRSAFVPASIARRTGVSTHVVPSIR